MLLLALYCYFYAFLILVTPLVYSSLTGFEIPKIFLTRILSGFFLVLFLLLSISKHEKISFDRYDLLAILWIVFISGSSMISGNFSNSFWGGIFRYQGIFTQICLVVLFITTRKVLLIYPKLKNYILKLIIIAGTIQSAILILEWIGVYILNLDIATYSGRIVGTLGQPNFAASLVLVAFALIAFRSTFKYWLLCILFLLSILTTGSMAELLIFIAIFIIKSVVNFKSRAFNKLFLISIFAIVLILTFSIWRETRRKNFLLNPVESRLNIWPQSVNLILKRPLVGYGAENIQYVFPEEFGGISIDRAHNGVLDAFLVGGVFLGGVYITIIIIGLKAGFGSKKLMPVGLAFFSLVLREQVGVNSIVNLILFWLFFSILMSQKIKLPSPKE